MVLCGALAGCGFQASMAHDGGREPVPGDAIDASIDGPRQGSNDCYGLWHSGSLAISEPQELATLSTGGNERDPWISDDRRTLYFASNRDGTTDIFLATRILATNAFGPPSKLVNLSVSEKADDRVSLTADEKTLVMASDRGSNGQVEIYITLRPDKVIDFGSPNQDRLNNINAGNADNFDPFLTGDGRTLYLAPNRGGVARQQIEMATRVDANGNFTSPSPVPNINAASSDTADPALSPDERVIVFSSDRPGGSGEIDLWYATRPDTAHDFSAPIRIPTVNSQENDADPMLSADGCELYFSSTRGGDPRDFDLFVAKIVR
jgi:Tol biopolymer transport system component